MQTFPLVLPKPVYASPGLTTSFTSRPTTHTAESGVDNPANAYDNDLVSFARIAYDQSEWEEVTSFSTTGASTSEGIVFVDFNMAYEAVAGGSGEVFRILYYVGSSSAVVLQDWIDPTSTIEVYGAGPTSTTFDSALKEALAAEVPLISTNMKRG